MRFLTPTESRLLTDLPVLEAGVVRGFFEELDARLVSEGDSGVTPRQGPIRDADSGIPGRSGMPPGGPSPSETSQASLFPSRKERP